MNRTTLSGGAGEGGEVEDLVVVASAQQHHVDLHGREPGRLGGIHGAQDVGQGAAPADSSKALRSQGVAAHVDPAQAGRGEHPGHVGQRRPVGRQCQVSEPELGQPPDQHRHSPADERLPSGDPQRRHAEVPGHASDPGDLVERQQLVLAEEGQTLLGHTVDAPQIAAIGDRYAKVVVHSPVAIDEWALHRHGRVRLSVARVGPNRDGDLDGRGHVASPPSSCEQRVQSVPPLQVSRFQMGTVCFRVSMQNCAAENASARCGVDAATTTDTSPTSSRPTRWSSARSAYLPPARPGGAGHPDESWSDLLDVGFVLQRRHARAALGVVAHGAEEGYDPAASGEDRPAPHRIDREGSRADADPVVPLRGREPVQGDHAAVHVLQSVLHCRPFPGRLTGESRSPSYSGLSRSLSPARRHVPLVPETLHRRISGVARPRAGRARGRGRPSPPRATRPHPPASRGR